MSVIPPPPGFNNRRAPPPPPPPEEPKPTDPGPPPERLTEEEVEFYFKKNLRRDQLLDPIIPRYIVMYLGCRNNSQVCKELGIPVHKGNALKQRAEIYKTIVELTSKQLMKYGYDENEVMERVKEIGEVDPLELQNPDGTFKTSLEQIRPEVRRAIKKFEAKNLWGEDANGMRVHKGVLVKVEFWDKMKAIELMGVEKNQFKKTTVMQHDVTEKMADILLESGNRADQRRLAAARPIQALIEGETSDTSGADSELKPSGDAGV